MQTLNVQMGYPLNQFFRILMSFNIIFCTIFIPIIQSKRTLAETEKNICGYPCSVDKAVPGNCDF